MLNVSSVRLAIPKAATGEIVRRELIAAILGNQQKITYIHAGAGFGKTTLLAQVAGSVENVVWVTLDGESDLFSFLELLSEALRQTFPHHDFAVSEYLPFADQSNFVTLLANALISSVERLNANLMIILDDLHTIIDAEVRALIACIMKYKPESVRLCLSSRETPWQELIPLRVRGSIFELTQQELAFTRSEASQLLGFDDEHLFGLTEGWPLAIGSFRVLLANGVAIGDLPSRGHEALYSFLFYECISRLSPELTDFLRASACFEELDPPMLDTVLGKKNARLLLESLAGRHLFTIKTDGGYFRYHMLFREYLLEGVDSSQIASLQKEAAAYYFDTQQYSRAAEYATRLADKGMLEQIILLSYRDYIKRGSFSELRLWFHALGDQVIALSRELLIAKGAFLSSIGDFTDANTCLDRAIPLLGKDDRELYIEAMVHKARVLRNFVSFEASSELLDEVIAELGDPASELSYTVLIEKIYNLCWNSQIDEAYALAHRAIETCAHAGNTRVKAWFERYLSVVHFLAGRMKDAVYYYEKAQRLSPEEHQFLCLHSIDIYIAKAYQMMGEREKAIAMVTTELQHLRSTGRYEELWLGYLFAAEIHYQNTFIDRMNGGSQTFEATARYFTLAEEYAPLYRRTKFQTQWTNMQHRIYSLMFANGPKEDITDEILTNLDQISDYFKTIALARLFSYFGTTADFPRAVEYAKLAIEIGERADMMLIPTMAYGMLARVAIAKQDQAQAVFLTRRFLQLCHENGIYEYFRMRKAYDPVLEFAYDHGIELGITQQLMEFAGYRIKKAYITTLGDFAVFPDQSRQRPVKMRTKKERELLAYLLDAGHEGVTKEQIYQALWYESESDDVKKLIGVYLAQIKKDLGTLGIQDPIINHEKRYRICRDEIAVDTDAFEAAMHELQLHPSHEAARAILALYKGDYLAEFEALWAVARRVRYADAYRQALALVSS